ncbi:PRTRC system protein B [Bacteroides thetaiotaomicron]|jgi:hypothetical protein|uniref:PRTRC system protein B n=1 Tax=Bacteroides thetaiotaomicron TaxID=818 RepID=UPI00189CA184|nr:PRTRC system protein B [Bacteroides thetaiotaomicron]MDC2174820.1 PRTRC system protein B [Bacteroides thetaiotaomicron]MDC2190282.1 PRTRC system protein B [Bacteroides thetaiotaomicron]
MNELTKQLSTMLVPEMAIIVYSDDNRTNLYLERRDIRNGNMGAGKPLTEECIKDIADLALNRASKELHGIIPPNMLYADGRKGYEKFVWYEKPQKKMHYFRKNLDIPNGTLCTPSLLYVVERDVLSLYAFCGDNPDSQLYQAPYFNVSSSYACLGNSKLPEIEEMTYQNIIAYWEKMFWQSEFSHILGTNPIKSNLALVTKKLIKTGEPFPESELIPIKLTLKKIIG